MRKNKNVVTRFFSFLIALVMVMGIIPAMPAFAAGVDASDANYLQSCWGIANSKLTVYDDYRNVIGSISANEGFTVLGNDIIGNHETAYLVNYSTSSGFKNGYVIVGSPCTLETSSTCAGIVTSSATVYYGKNNSNYQTVGSVSTGEYVSILAESSGQYYIEYNTNSGRKRGWCAASCVAKKMPITGGCTLGALPCNAAAVNTHRTYSQRTVYAGPSDQYFVVGSIGSASKPEQVYVVAEYTYNGQRWAYISYSTSGKDKSGYIRI